MIGATISKRRCWTAAQQIRLLSLHDPDAVASEPPGRDDCRPSSTIST